MKQQNLEVVDLGLPSGTLWAKCNIGAEKETDCGKYFMWGDTEGRYAEEVEKKPCNLRTIPFNNVSTVVGDDYFNDHKYEFINSDDILLPKYDVAFMHTHGLMRMPTREQFEELFANTFLTWEENFNGSGMNGRKFISKKDSSKYIFFPASGVVFNDSLYGVGYYGFVWSGSLYPSYPSNAWVLYFGRGCMYMGYYNHYYGRSVRGVIKRVNRN